MKKLRPVYLNLKNITFPIIAISSIFHRISGIVIFTIIGISIWILQFSFSSSKNFLIIKHIFNNIIIKFIFNIILIMLIYHILNGVKHILLDLGLIKETLYINKIITILIFLFTIILFFIITY